VKLNWALSIQCVKLTTLCNYCTTDSQRCIVEMERAIHQRSINAVHVSELYSDEVGLYNNMIQQYIMQTVAAFSLKQTHTWAGESLCSTGKYVFLYGTDDVAKSLCLGAEAYSRANAEARKFLFQTDRQKWTKLLGILS